MRCANSYTLVHQHNKSEFNGVYSRLGYYPEKYEIDNQ